jgi:hypothetical protein
MHALDNQLFESSHAYGAVLFGKHYPQGIWYYYLVLLMYKTALPLLALAFFALWAATRRRVTFEDVFLLLPAALLLILFSFSSSKQLGLRMLLPAAPMFWLWVARTVCSVRLPAWKYKAVAVWAVCMAGALVSGYPDYLAYHNIMAGNAQQRAAISPDSNLDWGQDLIRLHRFMQDHQLQHIQLLYFGRVDPGIYGISYSVPAGFPAPGLLAVSSRLFSQIYLLNDHGKLRWQGAPHVENSSKFGFLGFIGNTLQVYRVSGKADNQTSATREP